jgi:formate hydrogenlyase subunit 5
VSLPEPFESRKALPTVEDWHDEVVTRTAQGERFAGLYGTAEASGCVIAALLVGPGGVQLSRAWLSPTAAGRLEYPALTPDVPGAFWYERALHDLSGVVAVGHPRLDPLLLARDEDSPPPRPGAAADDMETSPAHEQRGPVELGGHGMFTLPLGPVRSGVMESIELLIETPGEDIPHLNVRPHYKHRGIAKQFEGRPVSDAVLVAERVEGISSVAHTLAFCHAVEGLAGVEVSRSARLTRVVMAELERIANHLDVTMRLADSAGLAVATSRFGWHKETVQRLLSGLCGSRFGRGLVTVGGLARRPVLDAGQLAEQLEQLTRRIRSDVAALESSASFLDRLRTTGPLPPERAAEHGALGPIGRASGVDDDCRRDRPYAGYPELGDVVVPVLDSGDALSRARVRWREIEMSVALVLEAVDGLARTATDPFTVPVTVPDGLGIGWAESAQGEVLHTVEIEGGLVRRCFARSASFHNLLLLHDVFAGDIFTDLPFIEASFGLGYAGVAM